jgi:hypothetical protein
VIVKKVYFGKTKGGKVPMIIEYEEVKCKKNR